VSDALVDCAGLTEAELGEVLALVAGTDVVELQVAFSGMRLTLRRPPTKAHSVVDVPAAPSRAAAPAEVLSLAISSPLVGIFHSAVKSGDAVQTGQSIGAIEALGMPTSVDAPQSGTVEDLLVADGSPVEYGQPLLVLRRVPRAG
jgi:acetyl-CoA carboxylase biotin carboxyl carrier protein